MILWTQKLGIAKEKILREGAIILFTFKVYYAQLWIIKTFRWFIFIVIILLLYLSRESVKKGLRWLKERIDEFINFYKQYDNIVQKSAQSIITPFVLLGLVILFWSISRFLTFLFIFLFWVTVVYQIILHLKRKATAKSKQKEQAKD